MQLLERGFMQLFICQWLLLTVLVLPLPGSAKTINFYSEPNDKAKSSGTIDLEAGIIPIFTLKKSEWIKVADPRNGNVGWVKNNDLSNNNTTEYSFIQHFMQTGKNPQVYQIIQFGTPQKLPTEQLQAFVKQQQLQQQQIQQNIRQLVEDMNKFYQRNMPGFSAIPFTIPVIIVPVENRAISNKIKGKTTPQ